MIPVDYDQADWGSTRIYADGEIPGGGLWVPDKAVIHWGGRTVPPLTRRGERSLLRGWQRYHLGKGWRDIAYGYAVGNSGSTYRLRGLNPQGATSGDYEGDGIRENAEAVACVWLGGSGGRISSKAYEAMGKLVRSVLAEIGSDTVIGHRDVKGKNVNGHWYTTCPGDAWAGWIQDEGWVLPPGADEENENVFCVFGDTDSENVRYWQRRMNRVGGVLDVNGNYDEATRNAVVNLAGGDGLQILSFEADAIEAVITIRTAPEGPEGPAGQGLTSGDQLSVTVD